jgi:NADH dehydrogenase [ubiquinone] 1 alpha subcomplex assembly factor 7
MMTPLEAEIRRMIAIDGPIPVSRYMALCLGHPEHGYYITRDPLGEAGDFTTSPEISQMFGELIGLWAAAVWQQMGAPGSVHLVEPGPGRGTLMADMLRAAAVVPAFRDALTVHLVETSPVLRARQKETLGDVAVTWHDSLAAVPDGPAIVIDNEFFDALPIDQAVKATDGWHARMVGIGPDDRLVLMAAPDVLPGFAPVRAAPTGAIHEWRDERIAFDLARRLAHNGGAALVIDYGHAEAAAGDTFQAMKGHLFADPFAEPGEADLTAHVDFAAFARVATRAGARAHPLLSQGDFLMRLGLAQRAERLRASATPDQIVDIDSAVIRLTEQMSPHFKVLAISDPRLGALPGFEG